MLVYACAHVQPVVISVKIRINTQDQEGGLMDGERPDTKDALQTGSQQSYFSEWLKMDDRSVMDLIHGLIYARWLYLYIGIGKGDHPVNETLRPAANFYSKVRERISTGESESGDFSDGYHGKVIPLSSAKQLVTVNEDVEFRNLESIIPYPKARDIILKNPDHIVALECPCRSSLDDPCLPLDVCLVIGEPFSSYIRKHHPEKSKWITSDQAQQILEAEHARGHVHHAFFKDAMLDRFYAICNCCPCCCGAMQSMRRGTPMLTSSGYVSRLDEDLCIGCGNCADACPFGAILLKNACVSIIEDICMGCGVCTTVCPEGGLSLVLEPSKGAPLEIYRLMEEAQHFPSSGH
jgi:ferredoxin